MKMPFPFWRHRNSVSDATTRKPKELKVRKWACPYLEGNRIQAAYGDINYVMEGPLAGPLVVCLHGMGSSLGQFSELAERLIRYRFRVLRFDLWGHGLSSRPRSKRNYTPELYTDQLYDVLFHINHHDQPFNLIGFSMGGVIAVYAANQPRFQVLRVCLISAAGLIKDKPKRVNACLGNTGCCTIPLAKVSFFKCFVKKEMFEDDYYNPEKFQTHIQERYERFRYNHRRNIETFLRVARGMPFWENYEPYRQLAATKKPVLLIYGADDETTPHEEFKSFLDSTFGFQNVLLYRECKHLILVEKLERAAEDVIYFLLGGQPGSRRGSTRISGIMPQQPMPPPSPAGISPSGGGYMMTSSPQGSKIQPSDRDTVYSVGTAGNRLVLRDGTYPAYSEGYGNPAKNTPNRHH